MREVSSLPTSLQSLCLRFKVLYSNYDPYHETSLGVKRKMYSDLLNDNRVASVVYFSPELI